MPTNVTISTLRDWPHAPSHRLATPGAYVVTAGTYQKQHFFGSADRLNFLTNALLNLAERHACHLQAWAVFPNHYHFVAEIEDPAALRRLIAHLHTSSAAEVNRLDGLEGRRVWFQYWDTHLTYPRSFFARLNYVHTNPVRHGIVKMAERYPWCSAGWFRRRADRSFYRTIVRFPCERVTMPDEFGDIAV
jgi:putative transposase